MAKRFTASEWDKIIKTFEADPKSFGLPDGGREASLVLASFNIRKLNRTENREAELDFMARFCARCDLIAVQEIQDDLEGLLYLVARMESKIAGEGEFGVVVSDITGEVPGERGMAERLAFIYRKRRIRRLDMVSDLNIDRTAVMDHFFTHHDVIMKAQKTYLKKMKEYKEEKRKSPPKFVMPAFVTFVRAPHVVAFEMPAANDKPAITFAGVNAHLTWGNTSERRAEFEALLSWMTHRLKSEDKMTVDNFILLGDLNMDFDKPITDRNKINNAIRAKNEEVFGDSENRRIYFPFIDKHPKTGKHIRSNARNDETFDQIAFFRGSKEDRLPNDTWATPQTGEDPDGFNYGVFNFADIFARALKNKAYSQLDKTEKAALGKFFEHSVSDHMPIWVRLPRPGF